MSEPTKVDAETNKDGKRISVVEATAYDALIEERDDYKRKGEWWQDVRHHRLPVVPKAHLMAAEAEREQMLDLLERWEHSEMSGFAPDLWAQTHKFLRRARQPEGQESNDEDTDINHDRGAGSAGAAG